MKNNIKFALGFVGVATAYTLLVSYGYITTYYASYLAEFNVNIQDVNFWPSLYDFLTKGTTAISALVALIVFYAALSFGVNWIAKKGEGHGRKLKQEWLIELSLLSTMSKKYILTCTLVVFVIISIVIVFGSAHNQGVQDAKERVSFTALDAVKGGPVRVIIYQNNGLAVVKTYRNDDGSFLPNYSVIDLANASYETVILDR